APEDAASPVGAPAAEGSAAEALAADAAPAFTGQYGAMNPYGPAPEPQPAAAPEQTDADAELSTGGATGAYPGPVLEADLSQQAPYETAAPAGDSGVPADASGAQQSVDSGAGAAAVGGAALGGAALGGAAVGGAAASGASTAEPGQDAAAQDAQAQEPAAQDGQIPAWGAEQSAEQGYGQASPAGYGQQDAGQSYGQQASPAGYGLQSPAGYGQASPAGYGQQSADQGYGQASPAGYGQQSPAGYGPGSPAQDSGPAWTASTGAGEPPKKSFIARFWWLGCLLILLLALILIAVGGFVLFTRGGDNQAGGGGEQTTTSEAPTEKTTTEEPTEETTEEAIPTPTDLSTIDPAAEKDAIQVVGPDGSGTLAVHMEYVPAEKLESRYGGTVEPGKQGDYLVLTAKLTVTEGEMGFGAYNFEIQTPYGGSVSPASPTYSLVGSGTDGPMDFVEGDEYTVKLLFDVKKASGNVLQF